MDLTAAAIDLVDSAAVRDVQLRIVGGVAISMRCASSTRASLSRSFGDIDLCGVSKLDYESLFAELGYEPSLPFNRLNAMTYQRFDHATQPIHVDLFLDSLQMCHQLRFKERLGMDDYTLAPADLLLTKLQIVQLNEKDIQDIVALLVDHELSAGESRDEISVERIADVCAHDWGWWRTSRATLGRCATWLEEAGDADLAGAQARIETLIAAIDSVPKTRRWKARARIGDRIRWYDLPEDPERP